MIISGMPLSLKTGRVKQFLAFPDDQACLPS
jgi:hypothetical protein